MMMAASGPMRAYAVRLHPGGDLVAAMQGVAEDAMKYAPYPTASAFVLTAVGSLEEVTLRMANADAIKTYREHLEVVSLVGTFSQEEGKHLHITVSRADGSTIGGHLLNGRIYSTLELVLGTIEGVAFERVKDKKTGYRELEVRNMGEC